MITVAGFNTAIDRSVQLRSALAPGTVQRAESGCGVPGGKGVHVAQMVAELGEKVRLVGLTDELHGRWIDDCLRARRVEWRGVAAPFDLRQCLAFHDPAGQTTEVLEPGAELGQVLQADLVSALRGALAGADALVLSGSLPRGFAADTYASIVRDATQHGIRCIVDTSGEALRHAIEARPWSVKPNADEATALMGKPIRDVRAACNCVRELQHRGVEHPIVTLGADGAVAADRDTIWHACSGRIEVRDGVGSGDCFVAALAVGALRDDRFDEALRLAVACGSANATTGNGGFVSACHVVAQALSVRVSRLRT